MKAQWNPQYYLQPSKPCAIFVSLTQKDKAGVVAENDCIGLRVVRKNGQRVKYIADAEAVLSSPYCYSTQAIVEGRLTPADTVAYTLFVSTFDPGVVRDFYVTVYTDAPLTMVDGNTLRLIPTTVPAVA